MRRGITLVETLISVVFFSVVMALVAQVAITQTRVAAVTLTSTGLERSAQAAFNVLFQDLHDAKSVDTACSSTPGALCLGNGMTLILKVPAYSSSGVGLGSDDTITYRADTSQAPARLLRSVASTTGSVRTSITDALIAGSLKEVAFYYLARFCTKGDSTTKTWDLSANSAPDPSYGQAEITVSGQSLAVPQDAQLSSSGILSFTVAPAANVPIDLVYALSSSASVSAVSLVGTRLTLFSDGAESVSKAPQEYTLVSRTRLRNH